MHLVEIAKGVSVNPEMVSVVDDTRKEDSKVHVYTTDGGWYRSVYSYEETIKRLEGGTYTPGKPLSGEETIRRLTEVGGE